MGTRDNDDRDSSCRERLPPYLYGYLFCNAQVVLRTRPFTFENIGIVPARGPTARELSSSRFLLDRYGKVEIPGEERGDQP